MTVLEAPCGSLHLLLLPLPKTKLLFCSVTTETQAICKYATMFNLFVLLQFKNFQPMSYQGSYEYDVHHLAVGYKYLSFDQLGFLCIKNFSCFRIIPHHITASTFMIILPINCISFRSRQMLCSLYIFFILSSFWVCFFWVLLFKGNKKSLLKQAQ